MLIIRMMGVAFILFGTDFNLWLLTGIVLFTIEE